MTEETLATHAEALADPLTELEAVLAAWHEDVNYALTHLGPALAPYDRGRRAIVALETIQGALADLGSSGQPLPGD